MTRRSWRSSLRWTSLTQRQSRRRRGRLLRFRTNVDDWVTAGPDHPLRFEPEPATGGLKPFLHVRRDLWAKVTRALFYDLVELGEEREIDGARMFGVASRRRVLRHGAGRQHCGFAGLT